jgi:hypothetical protein
MVVYTPNLRTSYVRYVSTFAGYLRASFWPVRNHGFALWQVLQQTCRLDFCGSALARRS